MNKYFYSFAILFFSLSIFSQEFGGTPIEGVVKIKNVSSDFGKKNNTIGEPIEVNTSVAGAPTGNSDEVGITEGQLAVSLTGAATYGIPIAVPPGINGVVPKISLNYSSQASNGIAGYGWELSGISMISRIASTIYHDDRIDPINFNEMDRFALDGQRLVLKSGTSGVYGANGTRYETENFSNLKITSHGGTSFHPTSFVVEYPDGSTASYASRIDVRSNWALTYWQNPQGVRINYEYIPEGDALMISSIKYGSTYGNAPINEIKFVYNNRIRTEKMYVFDIPGVTSSKILKEIRVKGNGIGFKNYYLNHNVTSLGYERLSSITENVGDDSIALNPTVFTYGETLNEINYVSTTTNLTQISGVEIRNCATVPGDYNGDGKMDFVLYPTIGPNAKKVIYLLENIDGSANTMGLGNIDIGNFEEIFPTNWISHNNKLVEYQGIGAVKNISNNITVHFNNYYSFAGSINLENQKIVTFPNSNAKKYISGDFNGDGLTDVMAIEWGAGLWKTYFIDLDRRKTTNFMNYVGDNGGFGSTKILNTADVNGDGKTDLLVFTKEVWKRIL